MFSTILKLALRSLFANKMRSLLTMLGIVVGISTVIIVLSVGEGVRSLILDQLSSITSDMIFVEVQVPLKGTKNEKNTASGSAIARGVQITTMKIKDVEDIKKLPNIKVAAGQNFGQAKMTYRNNKKTGMLYAVQSSYLELEEPKIAKGRFFTDDEDRSLARVVVLGSNLKESLFGTEDPIGKNMKMNQTNFKVIGVMEERGMQYFMNLDDIAYVPVESAQKFILGIDYILYFGAKMKNPDMINQTIYNIQRTLRRNHNIKDPEKDDFAVRTQDEAMEIIDTVTGGISLLLFSIAAISLVVGGVGIMNVMYVTVTERTREIGLKKSIGARPFVILLEFIFEAVIVTLIGGVIGIIWGVFVSWLVSFVANLLSFSWPFIISYDGIVISFLISAGIGVAFGYAPAKRAARLHPIEALRHE